MEFKRLFTSSDKPVVEQIEWKIVPAEIDRKTAQIADVEVPKHWSQHAANIFADMYLRKAGVPNSVLVDYNPVRDFMPTWLLPSRATSDAEFGSEISAQQVFHRLVGAWTYWGWREGFFENEEAAQIFYDELYWCLAMQIAAPNSPQWFNTGLHWAYGIVGPDSGRWRVNPTNGLAQKVEGSYVYPQPHACFLTPTSDDLVNPGGIMDTWVREASIFKGGSGSGINASKWRAKGEKLSGGGIASGGMSWLSIGDKAAGAIQSGGTTRRAAKLVLLDDDHPELMEFIQWKVREEGKAAALDVGSQVLRNMYKTPEYIDTSVVVKTPQPMIDRLKNGFEPEALPATWESENMKTIDGQNSNNSIRATDKFMRAAQEGVSWNLIARTTGEVMKTVNAGEVWNELCRAAWACADPGLLFHDIINSWNTCAADGVIHTSNPCCEFHHLDGSACNLASLKLTAFLRPDGTFDLNAYIHVIRLFTMVLDISVSMASFPAQEFAEGAWKYRTLGLGYMNLGGLLMRLAIPYDSDEGRALASGLTALMTGVAYRTSAEMAEHLGPFPRWEANASSFYEVMQKHNSAVHYAAGGTSGLAAACFEAAFTAWNNVIKASSFRNAQTTLIAPTGTISLTTDCDTSGMEPDFALVKNKQLAGGGSMKIVNQAIPEAAKRLGLHEGTIEKLLMYIEMTGGVEGSGLSPRCLKVFDCVAELEPMAHIKMVAAIQPFLSGAASKTVNLPNSATVEDVSNVYRTAWEMGIKAISLYRDGSKLTQPLAAVKKAAEPVMLKEITTLGRGQREQLPPRHKAETQKARVGGQTLHYTLGFYDDGRVAEVFINLANAGSTLGGFAGSLAKLASIALGYGAPAEKVFDAMLGVKFEPSGFVELHSDVKQCDSIPDLIARDVMINHLGRTELSHALHVVSPAVIVGKVTGETCRECGGLLIQDGKCKSCTNCGERIGGCG